MTDSLIITSGWHPALARMEMQALMPAAQVVHQRLLSVPDATPATRSSLLGGVLSVLHALEAESGRPELELADVVDDWFDGATPFVARGERLGPRIGDWHSREVEVEFGGAIHAKGHPVNLHHPEAVVRLLAVDREDVETHPDPAGDTFAAPLHIIGLEAEKAATWRHRIAPERPFFKPVSLDPRLARAMVNLGAPAGGRLLDPFCGTGGILVEASLVGIEACGGDLDAEMVAGTEENVRHAQTHWAGSGDATVRVASATEIPQQWADKGPFDAFVFDPPYGRNAWKSSEGRALFDACIEGCAALAKSDARLVTLLPWSPDSIGEADPDAHVLGRPYSEILDTLSANGWAVENTAFIRVHASLARLLLVCTRVA